MSSAFNGKWIIDVENSTVWDDATKRHIPDKVGYEVITLNIDQDGVQDYEVLYGDGPTFRMGYTSKYDDLKWVPYEVREVTNIPAEGIEAATDSFKKRINADAGSGYRRLVVGKPYGLVRTVYSDERTHYRLARDADTGLAMYVMPRRLAADGQSYVATILNNDGTVFRVRRFVRLKE